MQEDAIPICILLIILFIFSCYLSIIKALLDQDHKEESFRKNNTAIDWFLLLNAILFFSIIYQLFEKKLPFQFIINTLIIVILFAYGWFIFIEKLPKKWVLKRSEKTKTSYLSSFSKINGFLCLLSVPVQINTESQEEEVSEEDIREMITASSESGNMEENQHEYIENIFEFDDTDVEEICTHRSEVINLSMEDSIEEWHNIIMENRHTFYPIYEEDEDDVIGILDTRDYFRLKDVTRERIMKKCVDKPFFVPENMKTDDLFILMKQNRNYFAVVLDEYGGMTGIVTLHDIVETILGEMNEEDDEDQPDDIIKASDTKYVISGIADIEEVQEALHIDLPVDEYETFGGYILGCYGKLPDDGTKFDIDLDTMHVHVMNMKNHRIDQMIVYLKDKE